jgi:hypothetical protein
MNLPIYGKIKFMFQTTNQFMDLASHIIPTQKLLLPSFEPRINMQPNLMLDLAFHQNDWDLWMSAPTK